MMPILKNLRFKFTSGVRRPRLSRALLTTKSYNFFQRIAVPSKSFLELKGLDASKFLQGLCTSDVTSLVRNEGQATTFLNPKGRVMADAFLYKTGEVGDNGSIILELDHKKVDDMFRYLSMYKLRSQVIIAKRILSLMLVERDNVDASSEGALLIATDNRAPCLHYRLLRVIASRDDALTSSLAATEDNKKYKMYRYLHGLPEGTDIEGAVPFDGNMDLLHYINFGKGCYIGQELMARTKYKGCVRKRTVPFFVPHKHPQAFKCHSSAVNKSEDRSSTYQRNHFFSLLSSDAVDSIITTYENATPVDSPSSVAAESFQRGKVFASSSSVSVALDGADTNTLEYASMENDDSVGDVIAYDETLGLGLLLLKLETLSLPEIMSSEHSLLAQLKGNDAMTHVITFRPSWWPDVDPVTGKSVL